MDDMTVPPLPPITTFLEFYSDASNDPYHGQYAAVMANYRDLATGGVSDIQAFRAAVSCGIDSPNAYVGLFDYPGEPMGRSVLFHAVALFPTAPGLPTPWDGKAFAFIQDVVDTEIVTASVLARYFTRGPNDPYINVPNNPHCI